MHVAYENAKNSPGGFPRDSRFRVSLRADYTFPRPSEHLAVIPTAWGSCGVVWRDLAAGNGPCIDAVLRRVITPGLSLFNLRHTLGRFAPAADEVLGDAHGRFHPETVPLWFSELVACLQDTFTDTMRSPDESQYIDVWSTWKPRLDLSPLSAFQRSVLGLVARIPRGEVRTYGQIAKAAGNPAAARAVGAALRSNPFPVLIPCHRVIGASGRMTGFTAPGGIHTKKRMLEMENAV